ncbi:MAG: hypothetical protein JO313_02355 [Verrucomicrobia bacterium]|nr:hypothetical protein [Verrucomicrobiota bacterium]
MAILNLARRAAESNFPENRGTSSKPVSDKQPANLLTGASLAAIGFQVDFVTSGKAWAEAHAHRWGLVDSFLSGVRISPGLSPAPTLTF